MSLVNELLQALTEFKSLAIDKAIRQSRRYYRYANTNEERDIILKVFAFVMLFPEETQTGAAGVTREEWKRLQATLEERALKAN